VNQFVIQAMLDSLGHRCEIVPDGAAALRRAQDGGFDLVLMDLQMPVMDGETAARQIRALPGAAGRVPIVAMTANARVEDREACLRAGMDDYVVKPVERDALVRAIARAVAQRRTALAA
jgi:CheY-like chemotaxis protein